MTAVLWDRTAPNRCACGDVYVPQLNAKGKLVKSRDPAWSMKEIVRDRNCLQHHCYALGKVYRLGYQHHHNSKGSGAGYPDVHLWTPLRPGGGGSAYVELKRMGKDPADDQVRVMGELQDAGHLMYLARPCCLLTGVIDELMADFAGRPCLYVKAGPAHTPVEVPDGAPVAARPVRDAGPVRAPSFREPPLPGADPVPFTPALGYLIPNPGGDPRAAAAVAELEHWLRAAGIPPVHVPYPIRLVSGDGHVHVHCRVGLARPGNDVRVWRAGTPAGPFPHHLLDPLSGSTLLGQSSAQVAECLEYWRATAVPA